MNKNLAIQEIEERRFFWPVVFFVAFSIFLLFALPRINQSVAQEDLHKLLAAKALYNQRKAYADSPHLYARSVEFAFRLFGESEEAARLPGILSGLLSIALVFILIRTLIPEGKTSRNPLAAWGALFYGATPAVIQGSVIIDVDNTILVPSILFLFLAVAKVEQEKKVKWFIFLAFAVAVALWCRVTTPFVVVLLLLFYLFVDQNSFRFKGVSVGAILLGALIFLASWYFYCQTTGMTFSLPWNYSLEALKERTHRTGALTPFRVFQDLVYLTLWLGPLTALLFFIFAIRRFLPFFKKPGWNREDIFLAGSLVILGGYTLVGGATFGFPKYHCPGIPLMVIWLGGTAGQQRIDLSHEGLRLRDIFFVAVAAFLIQIFVAGDILYFLRYEWREFLAFGLSTPSEIFKNSAVRITLYFFALIILFLIGLRFFFRKNPTWLVMVMSLGLNLGMGFLQSTADYQTGYDYGAKGAKEAARFLRDRVPAKSVVIAPREIFYYLGYDKSNRGWLPPEALEKRLRDSKTSAFVISVVAQTVDQIQTISNADSLQKLLHRQFDSFTVGSFKIWIHKK